jgi:hypothetical protein
MLPKRGGVSAFAEGWATAKEGEARARARRALRPVSPEDETLVRNLADAAESFPSIEGADLNPLMERIRNRVREPLFSGPICRSKHHLIVAHEVANSGSDRAQLANMAKQAKAVLKTETLEAVADRGYFSSPEILACHEASITVTLTSGAKSDGRFGKQDFVYLSEEDAYRCPAGERLPYRAGSGMSLRPS